MIWANWGMQLKNITIIGNQFSGYDQLILDEAKRSDPSNCILRLLPYFTETPLLTEIPKYSMFSNRLLYDAFHSSAIMYLTEEAVDRGVWEEKPAEPSVEKDISLEVNQEVVDFVQKRLIEDENEAIWEHLADMSSSDFSPLILSRRVCCE